MLSEQVDRLLGRLSRFYDHRQFRTGEKEIYYESLQKIPPLTDAQLESAIDAITAVRRYFPNAAVLYQLLRDSLHVDEPRRLDPIVEWERIRGEEFQRIARETGSRRISECVLFWATEPRFAKLGLKIPSSAYLGVK